MKTSRFFWLISLLLCFLLAFASCAVKDADQTTSPAATTSDDAATDGEAPATNEATIDETTAPAPTAAPVTTVSATTVAATTAPTTTAPTTTAPTTTAPTTTAAPEPPEVQAAVPKLANEVKAPQPGDDPRALSGIENVMRIAYVLQHAKNYSVDGRGTVKTKIGSGIFSYTYTQNVEVYKDYADGVMIEVDIADSTLVSNAWQICYVGDTALQREPSSDNSSSWKGRSTPWKSDAPATYTRSDYRSQYGLFGFELTNYVLNTGTVTKWSAVTENPDGTFTQTIEPDLTKSTGDCIRRMRSMGRLSADPKFKKSSITVTFDDAWRILSMTVKETYSAKMSGISADNCEAETTYVYAYGNADVSDYAAFFARYVK